MMPVVRISDATLADLKTLALWLGEETPSATLDRIVSQTLESYDLKSESTSLDTPFEDTREPMEFSTAPGLTHTKINRALVDGVELKNPKWGSTLISVIAALKKRGTSVGEILGALNINASKSRLNEAGYKFHQEIGLSVQGQSAPDAWREIERLSKKFGIPVSVHFSWRDKPGAAYPGRDGIIDLQADA